MSPEELGERRIGALLHDDGLPRITSSYTDYSDGVTGFIREQFQPPLVLTRDGFVLEPLGPEHNERDYAAWTSSVEHIRATPGYEDSSWPRPMTLEENLGDLEMHARHFAARQGFTYTVLDAGTREVIGCVYVYPADDGVHDAQVRSWVRASRADLDVPLWRVVSNWLASDAWPFTNVLYASRGAEPSVRWDDDGIHGQQL